MSDMTTRNSTSHRPRFGRLTPMRFGTVAIAASLFAAIVTGCGSDDSSNTSTAATATGPLPDAAQIVQESARTTQTLQAVHLDLAVTNIPNLPVETVKADVTNQPQGAGAAQGEAKVRTKEDAPFVKAKFVVVDKSMYAQLEDGKYANLGPSEKIYDPGIILDKDKGLANVIAKVQNPKVEGRESVNGTAVVKVSGTIDASVIDPIVPRVGDGGGSFPITLYIADVAPPTGSAAAQPSNAPSTGAGPNLVRAVVKKGDGTINVTLSDWAKPVTVTKPQ
ncbi:LppX_LprAFG lipoprotein [Nocardia bovistercoris]|uniref:LppX_LprAFG lipoprotein n=1 Tax=Nocardia bovistercoris TaxID=2785916 RepID=A0A931N799_9NOCA|nr:LppX_LprAFG lipoprotein [Nocardia bovistercoris]